MKINKNSWHYRRFEWWKQHSNGKRAAQYRGIRNMQMDIDEGYPEWRRAPRQVSLCPYFWIVVLRYPLLRTFYRPLTFWNDHEDFRFGFVAFMSLLAVATGVGLGNGSVWIGVATFFGVPLALAVVLGAIGLGVWLKENPGEAVVGVAEEKFSIVREYAAARKSKVCPLLEFEE